MKRVPQLGFCDGGIPANVERVENGRVIGYRIEHFTNRRIPFNVKLQDDGTFNIGSGSGKARFRWQEAKS